MEHHSRYNVLGEGSFGCVVAPPASCESKRRKISTTKSEVGKIFTDKSDFDKELITAKLVAKVDPTGNNLLTPSEYCSTSMSSIKDPSITWKCEALRDLPSTFKGKLYQLMMPYGGERLDEYVKRHNMNRKHFLNVMIPVMEALVQLQKKKYCHQDIKSSNILVTPHHKAVLIDYSLMVRFKDVYGSNANRRYLHHTYLSYPPEYKSFYYKDHAPQQIKEHILSNVERYKKRFQQAWSREKQWIFNTNLAKHAKVIDVYSLGTVFVRLDEYFNDTELSAAFKKEYAKLVDDMIAINPAKRVEPIQLLQRAKNMLNM